MYTGESKGRSAFWPLLDFPVGVTLSFSRSLRRYQSSETFSTRRGLDDSCIRKVTRFGRFPAIATVLSILPQQR
jgi:hypothetical protein